MSWYVICIAAGYLLGNINTAAIIARCRGFDIRTKGSGNAGASNALVTMGKGAAVCSALVDILKAFVPVFLLLHVIHTPADCLHLPVVTGIAVMLGHMFPFWMQFRGGKGFASLLGTVLALDWRFFLGCMVILGIILLCTGYIALATILCAAAFPVWQFAVTGDLTETILLTVLAVIIICKHLPNLKRIASGTEIGLRQKKKQKSGSEPEK
ncbi:MAG: glycerol-3-phosphate acyltransferase [Oscillospiraceae bacterium]|nr:glycerol-3-phosphate acyltransferase [Oscillospiraceae bacterium]